MSSSQKSSSNNTCVICLEPLFKADDDREDHAMSDVGVASCGHPAHCACFDSWAEFHKAKKCNNNNKGVPCPTCQQKTESFVKIFLRPEQLRAFGEDDDEEDESEEEQQPAAPPAKVRRKKTQKTTVAHKRNSNPKTNIYKKRWIRKQEEVKALKLEAKNRKKCHHDDLVDLERSQLLNFRLMKQLESTIKAARFRRNAVGFLCFGLGWFCSGRVRFS